jgi:hypothetical protein
MNFAINNYDQNIENFNIINKNINFITENDNNFTTKSNKILVNLKNYQLKLLKKCIELEYTNIKKNIYCAVYGDKVSSGKPILILSIIANLIKLENNNNLYFVNNNLIIPTYIKFNYIPINIIICHQTTIIWEKYIKEYTNLSYSKYIKNNNFSNLQNNILLIEHFNVYELQIFMEENNILCSRVIIDYSDKIFLNISTKINCNFTWFITENICNLIFSENKIQIINVNNKFIYVNKIVDDFIYNNFNYIKNSLSLKDKKNIFLKCTESLINYELD